MRYGHRVITARHHHHIVIFRGHRLVKAAVIRRAREAWFLVDDTKFAQVYPAVICDLHSGAILTNKCPNPKYRQYTLIKETEV